MSQCAQYRLAFSRQKEPSHRHWSRASLCRVGLVGFVLELAGNILFKSHVCLSNASKEKAICI